jgi:hypothetical protein
MIFILTFELSKQDRNLPSYLDQWTPIHRGLTKACTVPYTLRAVCRSWYEICSSTPVLWSRILVDIGYRETPLREVERYLNASATSLLEINVTKREGFQITLEKGAPPLYDSDSDDGSDDDMDDPMNEETGDQEDYDVRPSGPSNEGSATSQRSLSSQSSDVDPLHEENSHIREVMRLILPHFDRCRVLRIEVRWAHQLPLLGHDFGGTSHHLEELKLWAYRDRGDVEIEPLPPSLPLSFPNMQHLVIDGANFRSTCLSCPESNNLFSTCQALVDVLINTDVAHDEDIQNMDLHAIMSLLSTLPHLKRLGFRDFDCNIDDMLLSEVPVLENLTSLSFDKIPYTISAFILQHQESRFLTDLRVANPFASPDFTEFDTLPNVHLLTIHGVFPPDLAPFIATLTNCTELNLVNIGAEESASLFRKMTDYGELNPYVAPKIRALNIVDIDHQWPEDQDSRFNLLPSLVRTRLEAATSTLATRWDIGPLSPLERLHVYSYDSMDDKTRMWLERHVSDFAYYHPSSAHVTPGMFYPIYW